MDPIQRLDALPRLRLCQLPTPIQRLERLEAELGLSGGPQLFIKRDDLTGAGLGGNKVRKLEFSLAEARQQNADVVLTRGGVQSNHCRQTALAARGLGMDCHLFLRGDRPEKLAGNLLPSKLCGAELHFNADNDDMTAFAEKLSAEGRRPYLIPGGASNAIGSMGYVNAAREIADQQRELGFEFDWVVTATGSAGTHGGLLTGKAIFGLDASVMGVAVSPAEVASRQDDVASVARRAAELLGTDPPVDDPDVLVLCDYAGEAYAVPSEAGNRAIELLARTEGILIDPTYTGKAMSGLLDQIQAGRFEPGQRILFIHTGGWLALFA